MEIFGEWLRVQRTARKLTHEEIAKRVGYSVSALRKIESGAWGIEHGSLPLGPNLAAKQTFHFPKSPLPIFPP